MNFLRRFLSVVYILLALFWGFFTLFGMQLISMGRGNPYEALILGLVVILFLVLGAVEAWRTREKRSLLQTALLYGPALLLLVWVIHTWFIPQEMKWFIGAFFS